MRAARSITGSGSYPPPQAAATRPPVAADGDAVERATQAFNVRDLGGLAELLAEDVVCCGPDGVQEQGKVACVAWHRRWLADFPDARLEVRARHTIDDVVVEEGTFRGRHDGVARTGRSVSVDFVRVARVRGGKHVSVSLMFDRLRMLEQLGLV